MEVTEGSITGPFGCNGLLDKILRIVALFVEDGWAAEEDVDREVAAAKAFIWARA